MKKLSEYSTTDVAELTKDGKYVLFFQAGWCPDCTFIKPEMPAIEQEYGEYQFVDVDRDKFIDLAKELKIMGIPSFVVYDHGQEIGRLVNKDRKTKAEVESFLDSLA
ncbi:thioredoxin family protein [Lactobacillus sp. DCY120]|uniref:Thioredoxin family protein n=1 Tax=Bombilactobacillus apium TaxID=2675299 RepID=A0A850R8M5_9LACO|nr:thioredoxin family protein [Bombilactobacillus apium]NVY96885.1 thioredoxin family protein [Bombilactobacillus apium]